MEINLGILVLIIILAVTLAALTAWMMGRFYPYIQKWNQKIFLLLNDDTLLSLEEWHKCPKGYTGYVSRNKGWVVAQETEVKGLVFSQTSMVPRITLQGWVNNWQNLSEKKFPVIYLAMDYHRETRGTLVIFHKLLNSDEFEHVIIKLSHDNETWDEMECAILFKKTVNKEVPTV